MYATRILWVQQQFNFPQDLPHFLHLLQEFPCWLQSRVCHDSAGIGIGVEQYNKPAWKPWSNILRGRDVLNFESFPRPGATVGFWKLGIVYSVHADCRVSYPQLHALNQADKRSPWVHQHNIRTARKPSCDGCLLHWSRYQAMRWVFS